MKSRKPVVTDKELVLGLRGDFKYQGEGSHFRTSIVRPVKSDQALCFMVHESLFNSFMLHAHSHGYFQTEVKVEVEDVANEVMYYFYL